MITPYAKILQGDARQVLKSLPDHLVDCVMTSPPYLWKRDYRAPGQIGQESNPEEYLENLYAVFAQVYEVAKPTCTLWVNIADTAFRNRWLQIPFRFALGMEARGWIMRGQPVIWHKKNPAPESSKRRFARDYEFLFFFTKSDKYYFKTQYEPYAEATYRRMETCQRRREEYDPKRHKTDFSREAQSPMEIMTRVYKKGLNSQGRLKRSVWRIATARCKRNHFATFPEQLCEIPIDAGCPNWVCNRCGKPRMEIREKVLNVQQPDRDAFKAEKPKVGRRMNEVNTCSNLIEQYRVVGLTDCKCNADFSRGTVLDPFCGTATTGVVALRQGKNFVGIDLNPDYVRMAEERLGIASMGKIAA